MRVPGVGVRVPGVGVRTAMPAHFTAKRAGQCSALTPPIATHGIRTCIQLCVVSYLEVRTLRVAHPARTRASPESQGQNQVMSRAVWGRVFLNENPLVRIHYVIIVMIRQTGLEPWDLNSLFQVTLYLRSKSAPASSSAFCVPISSKERTTSNDWHYST